MQKRTDNIRLEIQMCSSTTRALSKQIATHETAVMVADLLHCRLLLGKLQMLLLWKADMYNRCTCPSGQIDKCIWRWTAQYLSILLIINSSLTRLFFKKIVPSVRCWSMGSTGIVPPKKSVNCRQALFPRAHFLCISIRSWNHRQWIIETKAGWHQRLVLQPKSVNSASDQTWIRSVLGLLLKPEYIG